MNTFAHIISVIFNPIILLIVVPFLMLYRLQHDLARAFFWSGYTVIFLGIIVAFIAYMVHRGVFNNMDVSRRDQRPLLYKVCAVLSIIYVWGLYQLQAPTLLFAISFGMILGIVLGSIINTRLKVSIHVATTTALLFSYSVMSRGYYFFILLLIPLVAWARVRLRRHTLQETVVGGLVGILLSLCVYAFYIRFLM